MTRKTAFFEDWSWFKFNNFGLALGIALKFYTSVAKELKLKVRKFYGLITRFVEVTGEKLVGGTFCPPPLPPHILNRVKITRHNQSFKASVHRKPTFNGVFTHYESYLDESYKQILIDTLLFRCFLICSDYTSFHLKLSEQVNRKAVKK